MSIVIRTRGSSRGGPARGVAAAALLAAAGAPAGDDLPLPGIGGLLVADDGERPGAELALASEYVRNGDERGARVELSLALSETLELALSIGRDEERASLGPGERAPEEREIELAAAWRFLELDSGATFGLTLEHAWLRAHEGVLAGDEAEDGEEEDDDDTGGAAGREGVPGGAGPSVDRGVALKVGLAMEIEIGDRIALGAELFRQRIDGDGAPETTTGGELGVAVSVLEGVSIGAAVARLREPGAGNEYSLGAAWALDERVTLSIEGHRGTGEPDELSVGIEWRLF